MEPRFKSSFIPKASLTAQSGTGASTPRRRSGSMLPLASGIVFVVALACAGGFLLYEQVLTAGILSKVEDLETIQAQIDSDLIEELQRYANRLEASEALLDAHLAPSVFERLLQEVTLEEGMRFTSLDYERRDSGALSLTLAGRGVDLVALVQQADVLELLVQELLVSEIFLEKDEQTGETTAVTFLASSQLSPEPLRFNTNLDAYDLSEGVQSEDEREETSLVPEVDTGTTTTTTEPPGAEGEVANEDLIP